MKIYIYVLKDPINNTVRYIGQTNNLTQRLHRHLNNAKSNKDRRTLRSGGMVMKAYGWELKQFINSLPEDDWIEGDNDNSLS